MGVSVYVCVCTTNIWWAEARDAAKHPAAHRTGPPKKNFPSFPNVNRAEGEKPCPTRTDVLLSFSQA